MDVDDDFFWDVLFFVIGYVDDIGMVVVDDPLYDRQGRPVFIIVTENDGTTRRVHQGRALLFFEAAIGAVEEVGHRAPMKKRAYPGRVMTLLGIGLDLPQSIRFLDSEKAESYGELVIELLLKLLTSGSIKVEYKALKSLVNKLLHAAETIPLGRAHLFHLRRALYHEGRLEGRYRLIGTKARRELEWLRAALALPELFAVPMASRVDFPTTGEVGLITHYGDASREYDEQNGTCGDDSGYGAWSMIDGTFCFFDGRWDVAECARYSINVLELHVENMGAMTFAAYARSLDMDVTHVHTFIDNSSAENVAERGRTATAGMNELNVRRQQWLVENNIHQRTSRVASANSSDALLQLLDVFDPLRVVQGLDGGEGGELATDAAAVGLHGAVELGIELLGAPAAVGAVEDTEHLEALTDDGDVGRCVGVVAAWHVVARLLHHLGEPTALALQFDLEPECCCGLLAVEDGVVDITKGP